MPKTRAAKERKAQRIAKIIEQVNSTCLRSVAYDKDTDELDLEFRQSGARYRYFGPSTRSVNNLKNASSIGRHFNRYIRNDYPYERLTIGIRSRRRKGHR